MMWSKFWKLDDVAMGLKEFWVNSEIVSLSCIRKEAVTFRYLPLIKFSTNGSLNILIRERIQGWKDGGPGGMCLFSEVAGKLRFGMHQLCLRHRILPFLSASRLSGIFLLEHNYESCFKHLSIYCRSSLNSQTNDQWAFKIKWLTGS